jgi:predicted PurR-regulated permease PerM
MQRELETAAPPPGDERSAVPGWLVRWAAVAWRLLAIAAVVGVALYVLEHLRVVVVPLAFALFFTALLYPLAARLKDRGLAPALASGVVMVLVIGAIAGVLALAGVGIAEQSEDLADAAAQGWNDLSAWISETFGIEISQIRSAVESAGSASGGIGTALLGGATTVVEIVIGTLLVFVILFFFLKDGPRLFDWAVEHLEEGRRTTARGLGAVVWRQLGGFARGQTFIAAFNAVATAIALLVIGVPLVLPLTLLTFLGGFIPLVGPVVAGVFAGLVALADGGVAPMLWVIAAAIAIQQAEGNLLEPLVLGRVLRLHPLVVLLAVVTGGVVGGIAGAFVAAPIAASAAAAGSYLRNRASDGETSTPLGRRPDVQ